MKRWTKTESAIADYLCDMAFKGVLPSFKNSHEVDWIYKTIHGSEYGITNAMAQAIVCISDHVGGNGEGGTLTPLKGDGFAFSHWFEFSEDGKRFIRV